MEYTCNEFAERILNAKCPEDVFGELPGEHSMQALGEKILEHEKYIENVSVETWNANTSLQKNLVQEKLSIFSAWAKEAVLYKRYGTHTAYRGTLEIGVACVENKKRFVINGKKYSLYFDELGALLFEGYMSHDRVTIVRNGKVLHTGYVSHYGASVIQDHFTGLLGHQYLVSLTPDMCESGDMIRVETWRYSSNKHFVKCGLINIL